MQRLNRRPAWEHLVHGDISELKNYLIERKHSIARLWKR